MVEGNKKYTKSRSAILRQMMEELGRKLQGISTAAEANDQKAHQLAMHLDMRRLPDILKDEKMSIDDIYTSPYLASPRVR